jgi:hypothetical protein
MDPLSVTASIIAILDLAGKITKYLRAVKDAPQDRARCATEVSCLSHFLESLNYRLEESTPDKPWYAEVQKLSHKGGPLDQYKIALERLDAKVVTSEKNKHSVSVFLWKFVKDEVMEILARTERLKTLMQTALEMDHLSVPPGDIYIYIDHSLTA